MFGEFGIFLSYHPIVRLWTLSVTTVQVCRNFSGAFAKLRKATFILAMSVRLTVRVEQLGSHSTDCLEILHLNVFRKSIEKTQVSFRYDKNNGYFRLRRVKR